MGCLTARGTPCYSRLSGHVSSEPEAGVGHGVPRTARDRGRGGWQSAPRSNAGDPSVPGTGEGGAEPSGAGSRCTVGQGARPEPSGQSWPNRPGRGTEVCAPFPVSRGEGALQMRVSQGPGCPEMLRRRDVPEATDTGWHCPKVWAQRWGHGLTSAPGQQWDRSGGVPG